MRFKKYALNSFIDSFDICWSYNFCKVFVDSGMYSVAFLLKDNIVAVFDWQEFDSINETDRKKIVLEKHAEVRLVYEETIQIVFDIFPRTIKNEVYLLVKQYNEKEIPTDLIEISNSRDRIVKMYTNQSKDKWVIKLLDDVFCCVVNYNAAQQIFRYLIADCNNLIKQRWK